MRREENIKEDLISRADAFNALQIRGDYNTLNEVYEKLEKLPSVEPVKNKGEWIYGKCNKCGANAPYYPMTTTYYCSDYCPNCGSKMEV